MGSTKRLNIFLPQKGVDILSKLFENNRLIFWSNICKTILTFRKSIQDLLQQNYNLTPFTTDTKKTSYTKKISLEILFSLKYPTSKRKNLTIFLPYFSSSFIL